MVARHCPAFPTAVSQFLLRYAGFLVAHSCSYALHTMPVFLYNTCLPVFFLFPVPLQLRFVLVDLRPAVLCSNRFSFVHVLDLIRVCVPVHGLF